MKALFRLTLAVALLAGLMVLPSTASQSGPSKLQCAQFCMIVFCAGQQTCGLYTDANGQLQCGCHDSIRPIQ